MERSTMFKNGKPSISMGHLYHGELLVITRLGIPFYKQVRSNPSDLFEPDFQWDDPPSKRDTPIATSMTSASSSTSVDRPAFSASVKALLGMGQIKTKKAAPKLLDIRKPSANLWLNDMTWLKWLKCTSKNIIGISFLAFHKLSMINRLTNNLDGQKLSGEPGGSHLIDHCNNSYLTI